MQQKRKDNQETSDTSNSGYTICKAVLSGLLVKFVVGVIVYAILHLNYTNIQRLNYPADSSSQVCSLQYPFTYPYLFIDLSASKPKYRCVNECPSGWNSFTIADSQGVEILLISEEELNVRMGGICWSSQKQEIMKQKGFYDEFTSKENILDQFRSILIIFVSTFTLSFIIMVLFYCLPKSVLYISSIIVAFLLLVAVIVYIFISKFTHHYLFIAIAAIFAVLFLVYAICGIQRLNDSLTYTNTTLAKIKEGNTTSILLKLLMTSLFFNFLNFFFLILILFQYICLVSSEEQTKKDGQIYFTVVKKSWKYLLLFFEWFIFSNFIKEIYTFILVKFGYQINKSNQINCECFTFGNLFNIITFSFILMCLWLPLKFIELFKPEGATMRQDQQQTFCNKITRASYCCCGFLINKVHRYTFNPYLILVLDEEFTDINDSLRVVQKCYHKHDDRYDKSSLWIFRLSNYIILIIISFACMYFLGNYEISTISVRSFLFFLIAAVLSVQISRLNINMWSTIIEVTQFIAINAK